MYIFWALILQWALIYAFITKKKEEIKIIHSFYSMNWKLMSESALKNWPHAEARISLWSPEYKYNVSYHWLLM
jgi:hypothetical protein